MIEYLTAEQSKKADIIAIHDRGIDSLWLMENASRAVADYITEHCQGNTLVVSSVGNNGADGLCVARLLKSRGLIADAVIIGNMEKATWEFRHQLEELKKTEASVQWNSELDLSEYDVLVDGIFGIGLKRNVEGRYREYIEKMNSFNGMKIAIDVPSGLNGTTGEVMGVAFKADVTVTFGKIKTGMVTDHGPEFSGRIVVSDIGIPEDVYSQACL